jgi:hypothetical protein
MVPPSPAWTSQVTPSSSTLRGLRVNFATSPTSVRPTVTTLRSFLAVVVVLGLGSSCNCSTPPDAADGGGPLPTLDSGTRDAGGALDSGTPADAGSASRCTESCGRQLVDGGLLLCGQCQSNETCVYSSDAGVSGSCRVLPFGPTCSLDGICPDIPRVPLVDFNRVWGSAADDVWAVGGQGRIWHFDGSEWAAARALSEEWLVDIHGSSATNVWAVGWGGIAHFDGTGWAEVPGPALARFSAVFAARVDAVFVASDDGRLWLWNGQTWKLELQGFYPEYWPLADLTGTGVDDVWLSSGPAVRHRTASGWSGNLVPAGLGSFHGLALRSSGALWAATPAGVFSYDGQSWSNEGSPCIGGVQRLAAFGDTVWLLGPGCTAHRSGNGAWKTTGPRPFVFVSDVWLASATDGWQVGADGFLSRISGDVARPWNEVPSFWRGDIDGVSAEDLWAIDAPWGGLWRKQAGAWKRVGLPESLDAGVTALHVVSANEVWIAAGDKALRFDGVSFSRTTQLLFPWVQSLSGSSSSALWAGGGFSSDSVQFFDGNAWSEVPLESDAGRWAHDVIGTSAGEVYALSGSTVWRLADAGFVLDGILASDAGGLAGLTGLGGAGPGDLWLTRGGFDSPGTQAAYGGLYRKTDAGWVDLNVYPDDPFRWPKQLFGVETVATHDVWFFGHELLHWNGVELERPERGANLPSGFVHAAVAVDGGLYMVGTFPGVRVKRLP